MMRAVVLGLLLAWAGAATAIEAEVAFADPAMQARYEQLTRELRCLVCQNQTIADSNAGLAVDLRREVRELMEAGKSDDEIYKFLTDRYGDFVLYQPPVKPRTYLLWAAPVLLVLGGLGAALLVIARRARVARENPAALDTNPDTELP